MMRKTPYLFATLCLAACLSACGGTSPEESWKQAQLHYQKQEFQSARIELMNAAEHYGRRADFAILEAQIYISLGDGIAAEAAAKRAQSLGAKTEKVGFLLAESYLLLGQAERALELAQSGKIGSGGNAARISGEALIAMGQLDAAKLELEKALASGSETGRVHIMLGNLAVASGDLIAADGHAAKAKKILPKHPGGPLLAARIAVARNMPKRAAKQFGLVLALRPGHQHAMLGRATALFEAGDLKGASTQLNEASALFENDPKVQFLQARLALAKGDADGAHRIMQMIASDLDEDPAALAFAGELALSRNAPAIAEIRFEQAILLDPETLHLRYLLAKAQLAKGDPQSARESLSHFDGLDEQPVEVAALRQKLAAL